MRTSPGKRSARTMTALLLTGLLGAAALRVLGQNGSVGGPPTSAPPNRPRPGADEPSPFPPDLQAKALKAQNQQRQDRIVSDTKKLLALAEQLQTEVDKKGKSISSVAVQKRADEIERLARSVKDKMKAP